MDYLSNGEEKEKGGRWEVMGTDTYQFRIEGKHSYMS